MPASPSENTTIVNGLDPMNGNGSGGVGGVTDSVNGEVMDNNKSAMQPLNSSSNSGGGGGGGVGTGTGEKNVKDVTVFYTGETSLGGKSRKYIKYLLVGCVILASAVIVLAAVLFTQLGKYYI